MRQNATLQAAIAESTSGEKVAAAAAALNMVEPPAGETRYLTARPGKDPRRAVRRMKPPSERAKAIMANNGMVPGTLAEPGSAAAAAGRAAQRRAGATTPVPARRPRPAPRPSRRRDRAPNADARRREPRRRATDATPTPPVTTDPGRARRRRRWARRVQLIERRIGLLFAVFLLALAIGATKAAWLGVVKAPALKRAAVTQQEADIAIPAQRGSITDVNGTDLAVSEPAVDIAATPYLIDDATKVAAPARAADRRARGRAAAQAREPHRASSTSARGIPAAKSDRAAKLKIEGIEFIPRYKRDYPRDWSASQLLGSTGTDEQGLGGLEYRFDKQLRGADGERRLVKDAMGNPIEMRDTKPVAPGHDVRLTLDANLQDRTEEVLNEVGRAWQPKGATAIVMDPNSGAILALANWPRVNANALEKAPDYARKNRAIGALYEPGSTFKAMTVAAALEDGKVTPETKFNLPPIAGDRRPRAQGRRGPRLRDAAPRARSSRSPRTSARC